MIAAPTQEFRVEWTGNVKVYVPVHPQPQPVTVDAHELMRFLSVASA